MIRGSTMANALMRARNLLLNRINLKQKMICSHIYTYTLSYIELRLIVISFKAKKDIGKDNSTLKDFIYTI